jgi:hypothetical protein
VNFNPQLFIFRNGLPIPINIAVNAPQPPAPPTQTFFQIPPTQDMNIKINEARVTRVTVTLNLDSVLVRRAESFELYPDFFISSVQYF